MRYPARFAWLIVALIFISGCALQLPSIGISGKYKRGRSLLILPEGRGVAESIPLLEEVAKKDPFYKDTLTLLGRALYYQKSYPDAFQLLQRALVVNKDDEIAWLTLGLTRLRTGDDQAGFENIKTGVALINKVTKNGYRGYVRWDLQGRIRTSIRRSLVVISKDGLGNKEELIHVGEQILERIDDEEMSQENEARRTVYKEDYKR